MAILTISKLLSEAGLDITKKIKLLRHKDSRKDQMIDGKPVEGNPYEWYIKDRQKFIDYQSEQSEERFKDVDYIVSFIGEEGTTARMVGVYRVLGLDEVCILTILTPILMMLTPSKRAGLSKSSLCLRANRQQRSCKDITFSFSSTLLGERFCVMS